MSTSNMEKPTPTPVPALIPQLKIVRRATRILTTYSAAAAAFLFLFSGVLTLFEFSTPALNPLPPVMADLGLFFFGFFIGMITISNMLSISEKAKKPEPK